MKALAIYAGPQAKQLLAHTGGLQASQVRIIPAAAGGPKGLILGPLDRFIFGQQLAHSLHEVHLVGASIGAWRMATACLTDAVAAFEQLEREYIAQDYEIEPGRKFPRPEQVSQRFGASLQAFYSGKIDQVLHHPRYKLHIIASRGKGLLAREQRWRTPLGYAAAFFSNALRRKAMGAWLERVVFSAQGRLPFAVHDYPTRQVELTQDNFKDALQASCSIPFVLQAVHNIIGAPRGAYWDGGITDYHLHLNYHSGDGVVLYPHFQKQVIPGWLDKGLKWRHRASAALANTIVLAPRPEWVSALPRGKLPDRNDFTHHGSNLAARMAQWRGAVSSAQQLADEWAAWLDKPDMACVQDL